MEHHVGHRISFTATGPARATMKCLDCDRVISTGDTVGWRSDGQPHATITGKLLRGGAVVDGIDVPSTYTLLQEPVEVAVEIRRTAAP